MSVDPLSIRQIGPYKVLQFVNQGGMGWVFKVQDTRFEGQDIVRALKLLKPEAARGEELARFRAEAGELAAIDHPNLVPIYEFGQDPESGCFYYTMPFYDGGSMGDLIAKQGRLSVEEASRLVMQLLDGLAQLHDRNIIHRDIKPANLFVGTDGRARLGDLGIAKSTSSDVHTQTGMVAGTIMYMSPEQARGKPVAPSSDIFSVGLTLFYALSGYKIYEDVEGLDSTSHWDVLGYLTSLSFSGAGLAVEFDPALKIPSRVQAVVRKALEFDPERRFVDARAMYEALEAALAGKGTGAGASAASTLGLRIAVAGLVAAGVGVAAWIYVVQPWMQRREVEHLVADVRPLWVEVPTALQRTRDLGLEVSAETFESVEEVLQRGQLQWEDAQEDLNSDRLESATRSLMKARGHYLEACRALGEAGVTEQALQIRASLMTRVEALTGSFQALEAAGGMTKAPQQNWEALQAKVAQADAGEGSDTCAQLFSSLAGIEASAETQQLIARVETDIGEAGPLIATQARERADEFRRRAEAVRIEDTAFAMAFDAADSDMKDGDVLRRKEPLRARDHYEKAAKQFEIAAGIVPAVEARNRVQELERAFLSRGQDIRDAAVPVLLSEGAQHFASGRHKEATAAYSEAIDRMRAELDMASLRRDAEDRFRKARDIRKLAESSGASEASPDAFTLAESKFKEGKDALDRGSFKEAGSLFDAALEQFGVASRSADDLRATAEAAEREARSFYANAFGQGCSGIEPASAQAECRVASDALEKGKTSLGSGAIVEASTLFADARAAVERAIDISADWQKNRPQPPVLKARLPKQGDLAAIRNTPYKFSVTVVDPNESDVLRYRWTVDGVPQSAAEGAEFDWEVKRSATIGVEVSDASGHTIETSWKVDIKNRPPVVEVDPAKDLQLSRGASRAFSVKAEDPDGTPVSTQILLDGKKVSDGPTYTFAATKPRTYTLEFVARDEDGAERRVKRRVTVINRSPELSVNPANQVTLEAGQKVSFQAKASDPEGTNVDVSYRLGGKTVARGLGYTFTNSSPGTYEIEIVATDVDGATARATRKVVVNPGSVYPEPRDAWEAGLYDALRDYEAAIEAKDMAALERVWNFDRDRKMAQFKSFWSLRFNKSDKISTRLSVTAPDRRGDQARVTFQQVDTFDKGERDYEVDATLLRRADGQWQIVSYERRR